MKTSYYFLMLFMLSVTLGVLACQGAGDKKSALAKTTGPDKKSEYSAIEVYCICPYKAMGMDSVFCVMESGCETFVPVTVPMLINSKQLFFKSSDRKVIDGLKKVIFQYDDTSWLKNEGQPQTVILFRKIDQSPADTFSYLGPTALLYNRKIACRYPFDIIDSIKKVFNLRIL